MRKHSNEAKNKEIKHRRFRLLIVDLGRNKYAFHSKERYKHKNGNVVPEECNALHLWQTTVSTK